LEGGKEMAINLDEKLIYDFRDKINENQFFYENYRNIDGKNKWNIICSAMDWIQVTTEGLPQINLSFEEKPWLIPLQSLNLMQYIVSIDLLVDSIIQLFRVLGGRNLYPLSKNNEIFKQSELSDDKFFKHIRAVFGTHPVNLSSLDGVPNKSKERFYASYSTKDIFEEKKYIVFLYSNTAMDEDLREFEVDIEKINLYVEKRYQLLSQLMEKVDEIVSNLN
jgi:hypothetical protein